MSLWKQEFPLRLNVPETLEVAALACGFVDTSWHNDVCASFERQRPEGTTARLNVDYENPEDREFGAALKRFELGWTDDGGEWFPILSTDDVEEMIRAIKEETTDAK